MIVGIILGLVLILGSGLFVHDQAQARYARDMDSKLEKIIRMLEETADE